ncbi:hypothetical protein J5N97_021414 [Dioscorea zingiberensis]|uniref:cellulase n=1 Tax=Dioscorea zingiberensis TaxID=325984 RepID=A0A9D5HEK5_9LILI|nr:hypothetical protein J5N97_021414 [Dioscorea zingiberensis]
MIGGYDRISGDNMEKSEVVFELSDQMPVEKKFTHILEACSLKMVLETLVSSDKFISATDTNLQNLQQELSSPKLWVIVVLGNQGAIDWIQKKIAERDNAIGYIVHSHWRHREGRTVYDGGGFKGSVLVLDELGIDSSIISIMLDDLEQLLKGITIMTVLTLRTTDYLVSFGECMSTTIFAAYMYKLGSNSRQYNALAIGFITQNDFTNAKILEALYPTVPMKLHSARFHNPELQHFYNSTGYAEELLCAAGWFFHATGDQSYLSYVTVEHGNSLADWGRPIWFRWDNILLEDDVGKNRALISFPKLQELNHVILVSFGRYEKGGIVTQVKQPKVLKFKPLRDTL